MSAFLASTFGKIVSVCLILLAAAALSLAAVKSFRGMLDDVRAAATAATDAKWEAKIAQSNTEAANRQAGQARMIVQVQADAADQIAAIERDQIAKRKDNEALPDDGSCGLDAAHSRLLIR